MSLFRFRFLLSEQAADEFPFEFNCADIFQFTYSLHIIPIVIGGAILQAAIRRTATAPTRGEEDATR